MLTVDFEKLAVQKGQVVLDAGCGFGRHSLEFSRRGAAVFSMDIDLDSLRMTRSVLGAREGEHSYLVHSGDALKLPFRDHTFDRIICSEVMEHVDDDSLACRELVRVLKPGGLMAITVPTFFSEVMNDLITYEYFSTPGGHVRKYLPGKLAGIMREHGLEVYGIDFRHSFHTIWWMIRGVVGLHNENHFFTRMYRRFLLYSMKFKVLAKLESFFDWFFPKSVIIYGRKIQ